VTKAAPNQRLKLATRVDYGNESFFFSAPQLRRIPLGLTMTLRYGKSDPKDLLAKSRRDLERLAQAEAGADDEAMGDALMDLSVTLTSLKDWLRKSAVRGASFSEDDVEAFLKSSVPLSSFRDIANELKHGGPSRESETSDVLTSAPSSFIGSAAPTSSKPPQPRLKITRKDGSRHRAIDLARTAVEDWEGYMRKHGLI